MDKKQIERCTFGFLLGVILYHYLVFATRIGDGMVDTEVGLAFKMTCYIITPIVVAFVKALTTVLFLTVSSLFGSQDDED